jgi:hypothetical protein
LKGEIVNCSDCGLMCFLLPFEVVSCLLFLGFVGTVAHGEAVWFILIVFLGFHLITQCATSMIDPCGVHAGLTSLKEGITDDEALKILEALRDRPPEIAVVAEAFTTHTTGSGKDRRTHTTVVHTARGKLQYSSWSDKTVCLTGLSKYRQLELLVEPNCNFYDQTTKDDLTALADRLVTECRQHASQVRQRTDVHVGTESFTASRTISDSGTQLACHNILATRSPGVTVSSFWSPCCYRAFCWLCPGSGTLYRILYFLTNRRKVLPVMKIVSSSAVDGFQEANPS